MAEGIWEIMEIGMDAAGLRLRVPASSHIRPDPGQYFLAVAAGQVEPIAAPLFFNGTDSGMWVFAGDIPIYWQPGTRLRWRGPLGCGFHLPATARKVALASAGNPVVGLPALISMALDQNASVVWYGENPLPQVPVMVEILPLESLGEALEWADYLAMECELFQLRRLTDHLDRAGTNRRDIPTQVLLRTPLTCGGLADCGVCAVPTRNGWKLACKDGPVFDLDQLEANG